MIASRDTAAEPEVLLSTGIGRLHLLETAAAIHATGLSVGVITGWAPAPTQRRLIDFAGRVLGQRRLFERLQDRRRLLEQKGCVLRQCPLAEVAMTLTAQLRLPGQDWLSARIWGLFGWESKRHLNGGRVFHVRSGAGGGGAIEAARQQGMLVVADHSIGHPTVIWKNLREHGAPGPEADGFGPSSLFWQHVMRDCTLADAILVNSDYVRRTLVEQGFDPAKIHVAYLGVSREWVGVKVEHRAIEGQPIRVLFSGHFVKRKGSHLLLEVARIMGAKGMQLEIHVAGNAHEGLAEAAAQGVAEMFRFHGLLGSTELKALVASSDLFVFPTLAEGCAKAAMEALGAGLPVITTRECGLPEAAEGCVRLVPLGRADVLAAAIEELGADHGWRERCGAMGADLVRRCFGPENFAQSVGAFYDELLQADVPARSAAEALPAVI